MTIANIDQKTTQTVAVVPYEMWPMPRRVAYADTLARAADLIPRGLWSGNAPSPAKIFLVLETGSMFGLHPMAALQGIDVVEGRAAISPRLMSGLIRGAGHDLDFEESGSIKGGDYRVVWTLQRFENGQPKGKPITADFDLTDAVQAGLCAVVLDSVTGDYKVVAQSQRGNPLPWQMYPKDMVMWRALGRLGRRGAADVLLGIGYIPEELELEVTDDGTRQFPEPELEKDIIARFQGLTDKEQMRVIWREYHKGGEVALEWTTKVDAEFSAALMACTTDSNPKKGLPGNTGDQNVDGEKAEGEVHDDVAESVQAREEAASEGPTQVSVVGVVVAETRHIDAAREVSVAEADKQERQEARAAREEAREPRETPHVPDTADDGLSAEERFDRDEAAKEAAWLAEQKAKKAAAAARPPFNPSALG